MRDVIWRDEPCDLRNMWYYGITLKSLLIVSRKVTRLSLSSKAVETLLWDFLSQSPKINLEKEALAWKNYKPLDNIQVIILSRFSRFLSGVKGELIANSV